MENLTITSAENWEIHWNQPPNLHEDYSIFIGNFFLSIDAFPQYKYPQGKPWRIQHVRFFYIGVSRFLFRADDDEAMDGFFLGAETGLVFGHRVGFFVEFVMVGEAFEL